MTSRIPETTIHDTRRLGAMTAVMAMLKLEQCAEYREGEEHTADAYFRAKEAAIKAVTDTAGPLSPFLSGFIEAIAEALHFHATAGTPDLLVWKPEAAMTAEEVAEHRNEMASCYSAES